MGVGETVALRTDVHSDCSLVRMNLGSAECSVEVKNLVIGKNTGPFSINQTSRVSQDWVFLSGQVHC